MNLENVDVRAESLNALVHCIKNVLPAESDVVDVVAVVGAHGCDRLPDVVLVDAEVAFRKNDDLGAGNVVLLEGFANDALGKAVGVDVCLY